MIFLLISFLALYTFLAWRRIDLSVMLFLLALPSYQVRFNVFGVPTTLLEIMILISFATWLIKNRRYLFENLKLKIKNCLKIENCKLKIKTRRYPFDIEIILLLIIAFISIASAGFSNAAFGVFKAYFFEPILVYILIFNVFQSQFESTNGIRILRIDKIIYPLALSAFCVSLYAIFQKLGIFYSPENFLPRVTGTYFYPNAVGLYLGPLVPLMIGWVASYNMQHITRNNFAIKQFDNQVMARGKYIFFLITIILSTTAIYFAKSEGALIGFLVAFFVMAMFWLFNRFKFNLLILKIFIGIIFIFVIASPFVYLKLIPEYKYFNFKSQALNYITDKTMLKDFSGEVRKQQWRETWQMLTASPKNFIFGAGLSGYQTSVKPYHQEGIFFNKDRDVDFRRKLVLYDDSYKQRYWQPVEIYMYPHNFVLNLWSEMGVLGVLLFIWIIGKIIYITIFNFSARGGPALGWQFLNLGLIGAFVVIIVHGLVDVPYFKNDLSVMFWVIVAAVGIIDLELKKSADLTKI